MLADPRRQHAYITYQAERANVVSRRVMRMARAAGLQPRGRLTSWELPEGGGLRAVGIDGGLTGSPVSGLIVVDDPHKNRAEAESATIRERVHGEFNSTIMPRSHPSTSVLVVHTRWHPDDLIGRLVALESKRYQYLNLSAVCENAETDPIGRAVGEALWPSQRPLSFLEEAHERSEYDWNSMYMGHPRPKGTAVFRDVHFYDELPKTFRIGIGIDLAYTAKTSSDWCVAIAIAECEGNFYVLDVRREQSTPPTFAAHLRSLKTGYPGARMLWYTSSTEIGMADLMREESGLPIIGEIASTDKFIRAQPVSAAWNAGRVFVPRSAPWLSQFVSEVCGFTGVGDRHDDQVDALAAAFDVLDRGKRLAKVRAIPSQFTGAGTNPFAPSGAVKVQW